MRAMDTMASFAAEKNSQIDLKKFVVAGASKVCTKFNLPNHPPPSLSNQRGWATWTTAAVDKRVIGIIPIVMDLLNMSKVSSHEYAKFCSAYHVLLSSVRDRYPLNFSFPAESPSHV